MANNYNTNPLDEILADKQTMTLEQLNEKYDLNIKWERHRVFPKVEKKFYTLESFQTHVTNEYKFNLQNNPNLKTNMWAAYISKSKEYDLPYISKILFFPENIKQVENVDLIVGIMAEAMGKSARLEYNVRMFLMRDKNKETFVSWGTSFEGERNLKAFDVIRVRRDKREDEISFIETHKLDHEYMNTYYYDPKEEKKRQEFDKLKDTMGGV